MFGVIGRYEVLRDVTLLNRLTVNLSNMEPLKGHAQKKSFTVSRVRQKQTIKDSFTSHYPVSPK